MEKSSQEEDPIPEDSGNFLSQICIFTDTDSQNLVFSLDWDDSDEGLFGVAEILYNLKYSDLVDKIYQNMYLQCVENGREEDFNAIKAYLDKKKEASNKQDDTAVVSPRNVKQL